MKKTVSILLLVAFVCQIVYAQDIVFKKSKVVTFVETQKGNREPKERDALITFGGNEVKIQGLEKVYAETTIIPYDAITEMVYERSSHSRVAAAILLSPLAIFAKRKHHWFTFHYTDPEGAAQSILLRIDKTDERQFRQIAPQKTGKPMETIIE